MRQVLGPGTLGRPRGIRWRGKWEGGSGWGTHVNSWLIHVNVWQNPLQYCKVISLQLIKINGKKYILMEPFKCVLGTQEITSHSLSAVRLARHDQVFSQSDDTTSRHDSKTWRATLKTLAPLQHPWKYSAEDRSIRWKGAGFPVTMWSRVTSSHASHIVLWPEYVWKPWKRLKKNIKKKFPILSISFSFVTSDCWDCLPVLIFPKWGEQCTDGSSLSSLSH